MNTPPRARPVANRNGTLMGELRAISKTLNGLDIPWALSGSMATKLHANSLGIPPHRVPNDIDIVIRPQNASLVMMALSDIGYTSNKPPSVRFQHMKLHHGRFSIDVLAAGGNLAPNVNRNNVVFINRIPVVKIRHLINRKNASMRNFMSEAEKNIAQGNINFLKRLKSHI